jgi:hypothetical protein
VNIHSEGRDAVRRRLDPHGLFAAAACAIASIGQFVPCAKAQERSDAQAAPGQTQSDDELAERALDRTLVSTGAVLMQPGLVEVEPGFFYVRSEQKGPGVFVDPSGAIFVAEQQFKQDSLNASAQFRLGLPGAVQLELELPYEYLREERVSEVGFVPLDYTKASVSGMGDINVAVAKTLMVERTGRPNLVARLSWDADTGHSDRARALSAGSGFDEARFSVLATKRQDPLVFLGGVFYQNAFEQEKVKPGSAIGVSLGAALAASPETSLRVVLNQTFVADAEREGRDQQGTNSTIGVLTIGASTTLGAGRFLDFTLQAGLTDDAPDFGAGVSLSMRFAAPWRR